MNCLRLLRCCGWIAGALGLLILGTCGLAWSQTAGPKDHEVKAAYLVNFAKFVEWPTNVFATAASPIVIGIVGESPVAETLKVLTQSQSAQGRQLQVRTAVSSDELDQCHVLYLGKGCSPNWKSYLTELRQQPVLTVGDLDEFTTSGGIIGFCLVNKAVRFDINLEAGTRQQLLLSSKLLAVARRVIK